MAENVPKLWQEWGHGGGRGSHEPCEVPAMDLGPAGLPVLPLQEGRNEKQLLIPGAEFKEQPQLHLHPPASCSRSWVNPKLIWV